MEDLDNKNKESNSEPYPSYPSHPSNPSSPSNPANIAMIQERIIRDKTIFLKFFQETLGVVSTAAQKTGINKDTVYEWRRRDVDFMARMDQIRNGEADDVEDILREAIVNKDLASVRFYLSRVHPKYRMKIEHQGTILNLYGTLTDTEKLERLRRIITIRGGGIGERKLDLLNGGNSPLSEDGKNPHPSGEEAERGGTEPGSQGDISIAQESLEDNPDHHRLSDSKISEGPESEDFNNE